MCVAIFALLLTAHFGAAWYVYWLGFLFLVCAKQTGSTVYSVIILLAYHAPPTLWLAGLAAVGFDFVISVLCYQPSRRRF